MSQSKKLTETLVDDVMNKLAAKEHKKREKFIYDSYTYSTFPLVKVNKYGAAITVKHRRRKSRVKITHKDRKTHFGTFSAMRPIKVKNEFRISYG